MFCQTAADRVFMWYPACSSPSLSVVTEETSTEDAADRDTQESDADVVKRDVIEVGFSHF
jgi:hypothetical protein